MTPKAFEETVLASKSSSWIILFSASWSQESVAVAPLFGQLSEEYANCGLQFGEVELDSWPGVADQVKVCFKFGLYLSCPVVMSSRKHTIICSHIAPTPYIEILCAASNFPLFCDYFDECSSLI
jgi:hypothetical protein